MKYQTPKLRYFNDRILGDIGFSHLLIATAMIPAAAGILAMFLVGAKSGSAIWAAVQIAALGTATGVYLSKLRGTLADYEKQSWETQRDLDYSDFVKRLYNRPTLEYWVIGWGTFAARAWVVLISAIAASAIGDLPFIWTLAIAIGIQWSVKVLLMVATAVLISLFPLPPLPMIGDLGIPDGISASGLMLILPVFFGQYQRVRYQRQFGEGAPADSRELSYASGFYLAHEVIGGLLYDALRFGGGYERARDGVRLCAVEEQTPSVNEDWKPAVGDLHKGQSVNTAELVAALREAANAETLQPPAPENAPSLTQSLRDDAQREAA